MAEQPQHAKERFYKALDEVLDELETLPVDEYRKKLEKSRGGDVTRILVEIGFPSLVLDSDCQEMFRDA